MQIIGSVGLVLDIAGAWLLFKFGLPSAEATETGVYEIVAPEVRKRNDRMGRLGLLLLIAGFLFQLVAIWLPRD